MPSHQGIVAVVFGADDRTQGAGFAQFLRQLAGVDVINADDARTLEVRRQAFDRTKVRVSQHWRMTKPATRARDCGVGFSDAVVANFGVGHGDDLAGVGGIRETS